MNIITKDDELINAWKIAAFELGLEIVCPFKINTENGLVTYPILVKHFGGKRGTIIARHELFIDFPMPKHKDYYFSAVNSEFYSNFNKNLFMETLKDWGFYGEIDKKPEWYLGHIFD
jgi:hypothetical protein